MIIYGSFSSHFYEIRQLLTRELLTFVYSHVGRMVGNIAGTGRIWLDNVLCLGNEANLGDCGHSRWGFHNCRHTEDVAV